MEEGMKEELINAQEPCREAEDFCGRDRKSTRLNSSHDN